MASTFIILYSYSKEEYLWRIDSLSYHGRETRNIALIKIIVGMGLPEITKELNIDEITYHRIQFLYTKTN